MSLIRYEKRIEDVRKRAGSGSAGERVQAIREIGDKRLAPLRGLLVETLRSDAPARLHTEAAISMERAFPYEAKKALKKSLRPLCFEKPLMKTVLRNLDDNTWLGTSEDRVRKAVRERMRFLREMYEKFHRFAAEIGWDAAVANRYANVVVPLLDISERAGYTAYGHCIRSLKYAEIIVSERELAGERRTRTLLAAFLHDIGKAGVENSVLRKGRHMDYETLLVREHPEHGEHIVRCIFRALGKNEKKGVEEMIADVALTHHVHVSGEGYPHGIAGLSEAARITALCDTFDAITAYRAYVRKSGTFEDALERIGVDLGSQFNAGIGKSFLEALKKPGNMDRVFEIIREGAGNP
ncbi:HD domain protein [uncultured archaeon]|nr:HD domain protein [uncultured archaeon]